MMLHFETQCMISAFQRNYDNVEVDDITTCSFYTLQIYRDIFTARQESRDHVRALLYVLGFNNSQNTRIP